MKRWPPNFIIDLLRVVGTIYHKQIRLLKNGLPGRRDMLAFNQALLTPLSLDHARHFEESGYLLFAYEMAYQLDLFTEQEGHLVPRTGRCKQFFGLPPDAMMEEVKEAYPRLVLWNELHQLPHLRIQSSDDVPSLPVPHQLMLARRSLLQWVPELLEQATPMSQWLQICRQRSLDILGLAPETANLPYPNISLTQNSSSPRFPRDWDSVEGAFLQRVCLTSFCWMGLLQVESPSSEDPLLRALSPANIPPAFIQEKSSTLLQSNLDLLVFPGADLPFLLFQLEPFCRPIEGEQILRYHVDKKRFFHALQRGHSLDTMLNLLRHTSRAPLPPNSLHLMQSWHHQSNQIVISKQGAILEASSPEELQQILAEWPDDIPLTLLDQTRLFVPAHAHGALRTWLQGYRTQEIDYHRAPPRSLRIDASLRIEIEPPCDLLVAPFLEKIAISQEPLPPNQYEAYQITPTSIQRALRLGISFKEMSVFLEQRAKIFSSTARLRLETYAQHLGPVFLGNAVLLLTQTEQDLDRLIHEGGMASFLHRIGPNAALLPPDTLAQAQALLQSFALPNREQLSQVLDAYTPWTSPTKGEPKS